MKLTKQQIDIIRENTPKELKGRTDLSMIADLGRYQKAGANWSYKAGWVQYLMDDIEAYRTKVLVVMMYGEIM